MTRWLRNLRWTFVYWWSDLRARHLWKIKPFLRGELRRCDRCRLWERCNASYGEVIARHRSAVEIEEGEVMSLPLVPAAYASLRVCVQCIADIDREAGTHVGCLCYRKLQRFLHGLVVRPVQ